MERVKIAMIGVGAISGIYLQNITGRFQELELVGVCDLVRERAEKARRDYGIAKVYDSMYDAFSDPEVEVVLNLTRPYEHYGVTSEALKAGKHVYSEKPLGASYEEGKALVQLAQEKGLMLGGAPDTFLGAGIQTCRKLIDSGFIGQPIGASCSMICRGHESWHPDPDFYYQYGGGPMMDMGPYYVTALINLLGGVCGVTGVVMTPFPQRVITSQPKSGQVIQVETPTYVTGILHFDSGAVANLFTTFDVYYSQQARFEVYGSEGTLFVPDPNTFGGPVMLLRPEEGEARQVPLTFGYSENSRGLGLADMAKALRTGRASRESWRQTLHVLEILTAFEKSSQTGSYLPLETHYERGAAMANGPVRGILD